MLISELVQPQFILLIIVWFWILIGALVTVSAIEFLNVSPSTTRIIVAFCVGPFALNRAWWLRS